MLGKRASYAHALSPVERVVGARSHEFDPIRSQKIQFFSYRFLIFACNTDLGPKKNWLHDKVQIILAMLFLENR